MANYTDVVGFYVTVHAEAKPTTRWAGETAQFGLRLGYTGGSSWPSPIAGQINLEYATTVDDFGAGVSGAFSVARGFTGPGGPGTFTDAMIDAIPAKVLTFVTGAPSTRTSKYEFTMVKVQPFGPSSRSPGRSEFSRGFPNVYTPTDETPWGTSADMSPPEVALAVSLQGSYRGPLGRGRFYLGGLGQIQNGDGVLDPAKGAAIGTEAQRLLKDLRIGNGVGGVWDSCGIFPMIWNRPGGKTAQTGRRGVIPYRLRIGDHLDAQRRRQHQAQEQYVDWTL